MGTNYYWTPPLQNQCAHCGRADPVEPLHIGKSSYGWCFSLHVIPELGLNDLPDWESLWTTGTITDEYGETKTSAEMKRIITNRSFARSAGYDTSIHYMNGGAYEPGPNGLTRHRLGPHCTGYGNGTWDLIPGTFS